VLDRDDLGGEGHDRLGGEAGGRGEPVDAGTEVAASRGILSLGRFVEWPDARLECPRTVAVVDGGEDVGHQTVGAQSERVVETGDAEQGDARRLGVERHFDQAVTIRRRPQVDQWLIDTEGVSEKFYVAGQRR
jgi:hypothetical protein